MNPEIKQRLDQIRSGKVPGGYKKTKIGIIPDEWDIKRFSEVFVIKAGGDIKKENLSSIKTDNFKYPVYSNSEQNEGLFGYSDMYKISDNSITVTGRGALGIAVARFRKFYPIVRLLVLIPKFKFDIKYCENQINKVNFFIESTGVPQLTGPQISSYKIILPPLPEQRRIAEILSTWDKAIELKEKLLEQKKLQKKGLMQQLLTGKLRTINPKTGKPFEGGWQEVKLGDVTKQVTRFIEFDDNELYNLVSVRRRSEGLFFRESLYGNQILTKNLQQIKENDFLISKMQIVHGASGLVTGEFEDSYVSSSYIILRCKENYLYSPFLDYYSKLPYFYHLTYVSSYGVHIEKMTFNLNLFLKEKIRIPNKINEQQAIASILTQADQEIVLLEVEIEHLKEQKRGLMQLLLTGVVRV